MTEASGYITATTGFHTITTESSLVVTHSCNIDIQLESDAWATKPEIKLKGHLQTTQYALPSTSPLPSKPKSIFFLLSLALSPSPLLQQLQKRCARMLVGGGALF